MYLEDLVAEPEAAEGRWAGLGHQGHEDALVDGLDAKPDLAVAVLAAVSELVAIPAPGFRLQGVQTSTWLLRPSL